MLPVSHDSSGSANGKFARKTFLIFFTIAIIPIGMVLALVYGRANWLLQQMTLVDQQRAVVMLIGTVLAVTGLVALAARRLTSPINQLVHIVGSFAEGRWDQRANVRSNDEIGLLARLFNHIADEMQEHQDQMILPENNDGDSSHQAIIQIAKIAASSVSLDELLSDCLDLIIKQFSCNYACVYLIERKDVAGTTFAILAKSIGALELDHVTDDLNQRLKLDRINLDTTPTLDWLVGQAIASRRPQVGSNLGDTCIHEAAIPIIQNTAGDGEHVLGVLDLFVISRVNDNRLRPFSSRIIAEIQNMVSILALGLAKYLRNPGTTSVVATGKLSSFLPDLEIVFNTCRRMAEAKTNDDIVQAMCQALHTSPYSSALLLRPEDNIIDASKGKVPMQVIECRSIRSLSLLSTASTKSIISPQLDTIERYFFDRQNEMLLISDVNQTEKNLDRHSQMQTNSTFPGGLDEPQPPREMVLIARWLGCRTAAMLPEVRNGKLLAVLLIGSTAEMPPLTGKPELLEPYQDLLSLAVTGLEHIQTQQNIYRKFIELESFWQISQAISFETDLNALYSLIHRQVEQAMGQISSFGIVLYDADVNQVSIPYMVEEGEWLKIASFPLGKGFSSEIIRTRQSLLMLTQDEIEAKTHELEAMQVGEAPKSWLGVPMLFGGRVIGLIIVQDVKQEYRFNAQDERLLSVLATQVAVVMRYARLLEATRRQAKQERLVNEISDRIRRQVDVESILKTTTDELSRALGARRATMRIDPQLVDAADKDVVPNGDSDEESSSMTDKVNIVSSRDNVADLASPNWDVPIEMMAPDQPGGEAIE